MTSESDLCLGRPRLRRVATGDRLGMPYLQDSYTSHRILHRDETSKHLPFVLESPSPRTTLPGAMPVSRDLPRAGVYDVKYLCDPECHRLSVDSPVDISSLEGFQVSGKAATLLHRALQHEHGLRGGASGALPHVASFAALDQEIRQMTLALLQDSVDWRYALVSLPAPLFPNPPGSSGCFAVAN